MYLNADVHACVQMYRQRVTEGSREKKTNKEDMNKVVYEKAGVDYTQTSALFPFFFFFYSTYSLYQCRYFSQLCLHRHQLQRNS